MAGPDRPPPAAGSSRHREYKVQPPRPPNAWILYRSYKFGQIRQNHERVSQADVSKIISDLWKNESEHVKRHFERMADDKKAEHQELYPDYRFSPKRKEDKMRAKEDRKQSRRAKKKARNATLADTDANADADATVTMPAPLPMPYMPQPYYVPGYQPNMVLPQPYLNPYLLEARYGPAGPSPPISAAPSPAPYESSESPEAQPYLGENVPSSSSSPSTRPSPGSESQASSSSSQLPPNPMHLLSLPSSHQPSPNSYATQPLPTLLFQSSAPSELPLASPQAQLQSAENTVVPAAPAIPTQLFNSHNSQEVVNFDIPISQTPNFAQFPQSLCASSSLESLERMFGSSDESDVFDMSNVDDPDLLAQPQGDLDVGMGPQASTVDYNKGLFADFDFVEFQRQMASFTESGSSSAAIASPPVQEDLQALFYTPNNPEVQAYTTARQRQPSVFTQEMMDFFDFEAAEGSTEDTSATISPVPVPVPDTVAPQQVRLQSTQHTAAMPIFTQMTNTPTAALGTSYVPPVGAIHSSMRRVAASWKSSFPILPSQVEEPIQSWTTFTN